MLIDPIMNMCTMKNHHEPTAPSNKAVTAYRERVILDRIRERPYPADEIPYNHNTARA
jgi:hypothetical protein